jgi:hypothetical protein
VEENRAAVLLAEVRALAVYLRRVVFLPKDIQELLETNLRRVKRDLYYFGVAGSVGADVFVSGVSGVAAGVADGGIEHAGHAAECGFYTPETACAKCCDFGFGHRILLKNSITSH